MKAINGIIDSVKLGFEDHGLIVLNLYLKLEDGAMCCFGNFTLGSSTPSVNMNGQTEGNYCAWYIAKVLQIADVEDVEHLKGRPVRAIFKNDGKAGDTCIGIQHFLRSNLFFIPKYASNPEGLNFDGIFSYVDNKGVHSITNYVEFKWIQDLNKAQYAK